jgi:hypothetical protein
MTFADLLAMDDLTLALAVEAHGRGRPWVFHPQARVYTDLQ